MYSHRLLTDEDMFVLSGVCRGFRIIDKDVEVAYTMSKYNSILNGSMHEQMCNSVKKELLEGRISLVQNPPRCIHAMGAVKRPDGRLRAIMDCSRLYNSINHFMLSTAEKFQFSKVEDTKGLVVQGGWGCVVDISNAYRHIPIYPPHRDFVGFQWEMDGVKRLFVDNYLCFGLPSAPYIFNAVSNLEDHPGGEPMPGLLGRLFLSGGFGRGMYSQTRITHTFVNKSGFHCE